MLPCQAGGVVNLTGLVEIEEVAELGEGYVYEFPDQVVCEEGKRPLTLDC